MSGRRALVSDGPFYFARLFKVVVWRPMRLLRLNSGKKPDNNRKDFTMSFSIQTNVNSLVAQENLRVNSNFQTQTISG